MNTRSPVLELRGITKTFGNFTAVHGIDLTVAEGEFFTIVGPSGSGKTTVLRMLAGLESPSGGDILLRGQRINDVPANRRPTCMVFQSLALFPHRTVGENIEFPLKIRDVPPAERKARALQLMAQLRLPEGYYGKNVTKCSGGERQRVALARALAPRPELVLLDEPFSNLDVDLRERLSVEVREILKSEGMTAVLVTHDQHEAFAMADEIGVMYEGRIQQWDTPYNLYHQPANRFVADFVGKGVFVPGTVLDANRVRIELGELDSGVPVECGVGCAACGKGCGVDVLLRPDDVIHDDASPTRAEVRHKAFRGADILYTLRLASGTEVLSLVPSHHDHALGEAIGVRLEADHVIAFRHTD